MTDLLVYKIGKTEVGLTAPVGNTIGLNFSTLKENSTAAQNAEEIISLVRAALKHHHIETVDPAAKQLPGITMVPVTCVGEFGAEIDPREAFAFAQEALREASNDPHALRDLTHQYEWSQREARPHPVFAQRLKPGRALPPEGNELDIDELNADLKGRIIGKLNHWERLSRGKIHNGVFVRKEELAGEIATLVLSPEFGKNSNPGKVLVDIVRKYNDQGKDAVTGEITDNATSQMLKGILQEIISTVDEELGHIQMVRNQRQR